MVLIYAVTWIIADLAHKPQPRFPLFLNNWSLICGCLFYLLAFCVVAYGVTQQRSNNHELQWFHKIEWVVYETAVTGSLMTDLLFWVFLGRRLSSADIWDPFSIYTHAINYVVLLFDLLINDIPFRLLHLFHPVTYGVVYMIFTLIIHFTNFTPAFYSGVDWKHKPARTTFHALLSLFVVIPASHAVNFGFYKLRVVISNAYKNIYQPPAENHADQAEA